MKNHKVIFKPETIGQLWAILSRDKSIYFAPLNRVMPTKFFTGWTWRIKTLEKYLAEGAFSKVVKKDDLRTFKMRETLASCRTILLDLGAINFHNQYPLTPNQAFKQ